MSYVTSKQNAMTDQDVLSMVSNPLSKVKQGNEGSVLVSLEATELASHNGILPCQLDGNERCSLTFELTPEDRIKTPTIYIIDQMGQPTARYDYDILGYDREADLLKKYARQLANRMLASNSATPAPAAASTYTAPAAPAPAAPAPAPAAPTPVTPAPTAYPSPVIVPPSPAQEPQPTPVIESAATAVIPQVQPISQQEESVTQSSIDEQFQADIQNDQTGFIPIQPSNLRPTLDNVPEVEPTSSLITESHIEAQQSVEPDFNTIAADSTPEFEKLFSDITPEPVQQPAPSPVTYPDFAEIQAQQMKEFQELMSLQMEELRELMHENHRLREENAAHITEANTNDDEDIEDIPIDEKDSDIESEEECEESAETLETEEEEPTNKETETEIAEKIDVTEEVPSRLAILDTITHSDDVNSERDTVLLSDSMKLLDELTRILNTRDELLKEIEEKQRLLNKLDAVLHDSQNSIDRFLANRYDVHDDYDSESVEEHIDVTEDIEDYDETDDETEYTDEYDEVEDEEDDEEVQEIPTLPRRVEGTATVRKYHPCTAHPNQQ